MRIKAQNIRALMTLDGKTEYIITSNDKPTAELDELKQHIDNGQSLSVEIKKYRQKRSLDANAYCSVS